MRKKELPVKEQLGLLRKAVMDLAEIPRIDEAGWNIDGDSGFWETFNAIEHAAYARDESKARWLAEFTQVDDLGPMGRALFLAKAALVALAQMPCAAMDAARAIWLELSDTASPYRKVGLCKVLLASGQQEAVPLLDRCLGDDLNYVRSEAQMVLEQLDIG